MGPTQIVRLAQELPVPEKAAAVEAKLLGPSGGGVQLARLPLSSSAQAQRPPSAREAALPTR